jgi:hypothetical protein
MGMNTAWLLSATPGADGLKNVHSVVHNGKFHGMMEKRGCDFTFRGFLPIVFERSGDQRG